jgi:hypothetical protein
MNQCLPPQNNQDKKANPSKDKIAISQEQGVVKPFLTKVVSMIFQNMILEHTLYPIKQNPRFYLVKTQGEVKVEQKEINKQQNYHYCIKVPKQQEKKT